MEPIHPQLVSTRSGVDQQANRRAQSDPGATLNPGRLSGSRGVTSFLKVTVPVRIVYHLPATRQLMVKYFTFDVFGFVHGC